MRLCTAAVELFSELASVRWGHDQGEALFPFPVERGGIIIIGRRNGRRREGEGMKRGLSRKKGLSLRKSYRRFDERRRVLTESLK